MLRSILDGIVVGLCLLAMMAGLSVALILLFG